MNGAAADGSRRSLRDRVFGGLIWLTVQQGLVAAVLVALPVTMARLTGPVEIGLLEIAIGVLGLALMGVELGSGPQIVQRPELDDRFLATVFWLNLGLAVGFSLALVGGVTVVASLIAVDRRLVMLLYGVAAMLLPLAVAIVPRGLLVRRMRYRSLAIVTGVAGVAAGLAGLAGLPWGLLVAAAAAVSGYVIALPAGLIVATGWWPTARPNRTEVGPIVRYSLSVSAAQWVADLIPHVERLLIAGLLGPAALGVFSLGRVLMRTAIRPLLGVVDGLLLPGLAELQRRPEEARRFYLAAIRAELAVFGPVVIFCGVFAVDVVFVVFGPGWEQTALVAQLLAIWAWRSITGQSIGGVCLSQGRPDVQLRWAIVAVALVAVSVGAGASWGVGGIALAYTVVETVTWTLGHTWASRLIGLPFRGFLRALGGPIRTQLVLLMALLVILAALNTSSLEPLARLAVAAGAGLPIYLAAFRWTDRELWNDLLAFAAKRREVRSR